LSTASIAALMVSDIYALAFMLITSIEAYMAVTRANFGNTCGKP
jgi:hypothetical protein